MILDDIKELQTTPKELRKFGFVVGGVFSALALIFLLRAKPAWIWFGLPGGLLLVLGAALPRWLKYVYLGWMTLAIVLGFIVSNIILTLFFFLVVTPIGLVARISGRDFLSRKWEDKESYWIARPKAAPGHAKSNYEQQW